MITLSNNKFEISNLDLHYNKFQALKRVNLSIQPMRITAFIGPSGDGLPHYHYIREGFIDSLFLRTYKQQK